MTTLLQNLTQNHSDILELLSIGTTAEGRTIWLLKISDNVHIDENEPGVLLMGAHHGNEKPSYELLIYFIKYLVNTSTQNNTDNDGDPRIDEDPFDGVDNDNDGTTDEDPSEDQVRTVINNTQLYIIPMVNPDGVEAKTRKNRSPPDGVDLNRNYDDNWFLYQMFPTQYADLWTSQEDSEIYRGKYPFSENETQAVKNFVDHHNISISLSYHDFGEFMLYPWMHTSRRPPQEPLFRSLGYGIAQINTYELKIYGQYGTRSYLIPRYKGTLGTSENWLFREHEILAFTIEVSPTRAPSDPQLVYDICNKHVGVNLYICERSWTIEQEKARYIK